ncbi:TfpX/TfpZ family type IV pilin accessory protein [Neisseria shayeganii]|uniref:Fimbrial protein n=1 Tax=Neisseria shayeganii TaxID=607712 RepID=A0A7D7T5N7_9NEIS|nr:TfpX/TfpZ family type IV pilin accessory protein [Neisseria shayeganii]QMT40633.1 fimbrial protein [Neisseria shayeganii]
MKIPFRLKVFLSHLGISLLVALCSLFLVFQVWHPAPLQKAVGVTHIFLMLLAIDVVVGPLLSLLVASSKEKKTLKFDLAVICLLQIGAYLYGMHSIAVSRPVYLAFDRIRFELVQADSVVRNAGKEIAAAYRSNPVFAPQWLAVRPYRDAAEQSQRTFTELQTGVSPAMQADLYQSLDEAWPEIVKNRHDLDELLQYNSAQDRQNILQHFPEADGYLPLKGPAEDAVVLLNSKEREILGVVDLRPW